MNSKVSKRISRHTETLLVEWVKGLVSEEEADEVSIDNISSLLPKQYHFLVADQLTIAPNSPKWIRKQLKKLVSSNPDIDIESITLEELQCLIKIPQANLSQPDSPVL